MAQVESQKLLNIQSKTRLGGAKIKNKNHIGSGSPSERQSHFKAFHLVYKDLELKLLKICMKLDIYYQVQNLLKYHTKDVVLQILKKQNDYLHQTVQQERERLAQQQQISNNYSSESNKFTIIPQFSEMESNLLSNYQSQMTKGISSALNSGLQSIQKFSDASYYHSSIPLILKDNQKINQNVQKLVHQVSRKRYLTKLGSKLTHLIGLLVQLLNTSSSNRATQPQTKKLVQFSTLENQILTLIHYMPMVVMCKESIKAFASTVEILVNHAMSQGQTNKMLQLQSFALSVALTKIQRGATMYQDENLIKQFTLGNKMKINLKNTAKTYTSVDYLESLVSRYGYIQAITAKGYQEDVFLKLKMLSNLSQENNSKQVLKFLNVYIELLTNKLLMYLSQSTSNLDKIAQIISIIIGDQGESKWFRKANGEKAFVKTSLKIIKLGLLLYDYAHSKQNSLSKSNDNKSSSLLLDTDFQSRIYHFILNALSASNFKAIQSTLYDSKEVIQLIEDVKSLLESDTLLLPQPKNPMLSITLLLENQQDGRAEQQSILRILLNSTRHQIHRTFIRHNIIPPSIQKYQLRSLRNGSQLVSLSSQKKISEYQLVLKNQQLDLKLYNQMAQYALSQVKSNILGWNFHEKMSGIKYSPQLDLQFLLEKGYSLVKQMSKLMCQIYFKVGTNQKIQDLIKPHLQDDILKRSSLYFHSTDALHLFLEHHLTAKTLKSSKSKASLWRCWDIVKMMKYLGFKYNSEYYLNQMALKPLEYVESKVILLYLSDIFQSLRNDCQQQLQKFLIKKSRQFASVAHNALWFCKVESEPDKSKGRKVPLPLRENLPEVAKLLEINIAQNMTNVQMDFFNTETEFFERVTSISGLLQPKQPKDEKKSIIREKLVEYNKDIPESVYLPTNPNCKVVSIIPASGAPMQSAARVPILVSFEVVDYSGPDNDLSLQNSDETSTGDNFFRSGDAGYKIQQNGHHHHTFGGESNPTHHKIHASKKSVNDGAYKKKSTVLNSKRKTMNAEVKKSALMKHESVVLDEKQQNQYLKEINDSDSDEMSEDDDPNTSPKSSPNLPDSSHVREKLQMYQFIHNKNQDKFSSVSLAASVQYSQNTLNSENDRQQEASGKLIDDPLSVTRKTQSVPIQGQKQARSQRQSENNLFRLHQINEEEKIIQQDQQSVNDDLNSSKNASMDSSQQNQPQKFTFRGPDSNSQLKQNQNNINNISWSEMQNNNINNQINVSGLGGTGVDGASNMFGQSNYNESPERRMLMSKRYAYEPLVKFTSIGGNSRESTGMQFMRSYESRILQKNNNGRPRNKSFNRISPNEGRVQGRLGHDHRNVKIVSCIFKVNDDLRQDILALQFIKLFQKIFKQHDLDLFVSPYKCISNRTGKERLLGGIIECVPFSNSRDQLGKAFEIDLYQYFLKRYGSESSTEFKVARLNFIKSLSAYSVVSYILQIKDRHNGNILMDDFGHIIHIDFGFIFDWSPGKDMRFESANFKLTKEFIEILGGHQQAEAYQLFVTKTIQAYLAVREHAREFKNLVTLMIYSGFPCFKEHSLQKLEERFRLDLNTLEAAIHMRAIIQNAHDKWSTNFYDKIQYLQNKIVY